MIEGSDIIPYLATMRQAMHIVILTQNVNARVHDYTNQQYQGSEASAAKRNFRKTESKEAAYQRHWNNGNYHQRLANRLKLNGTNKEHDHHYQEKQPIIGFLIDRPVVRSILATIPHWQCLIEILEHSVYILG